MSHRWTSFVLVALVFALPGHPEGARRLARQARRAAPPLARLDASGDPLPPGALWRLGSLRLNAGGRVDFLAFTPDGKSLISAGDGSPLRVWDATTGRQRILPELDKIRVSFPPEPVGVSGVHVPPEKGIWKSGKDLLGFSLAGRLLFAHDGQATGHLVDTHGMRLLRSWPVTLIPAKAHAMTPDGSLFACYAGKQGVIELSDPRREGPPREVKLGGETWLGTMALSADGKYLAVVEEAEKDVLLCLVKGGKRLRRYKVTDAEFIGFAADGRSLIIGSSAGIGVYDIDSLERKHELTNSGDKLHAFTWVVPGKIVAGCHANGFVQMWDVSTGAKLREATIDQPETPAFAVSPDGLRIATANRTGQIQLWDARTGRPTLPIRGTRPILAAGFDGSGGEIVVVRPGQVQRHATRTGDPGRQVEIEIDASQRIILSPHCDRLAELGDKLSLIDTRTGKKRELPKEAEDGFIGQIAFLPDGRHALVDRGANPHFAILDLATHRLQTHFRVGPNEEEKFLVGRDGRTMYRAMNQGGVERWEMATGKQRAPVDVAGELLDVSPDGRWLAVGSGDFVQLVEIASGRITPLLNPADETSRGELFDHIRSASFSPDGEWIACAGVPARGVSVWNLRTGRLAARVHGHRGLLRALEFSHNGKEFLTASTDGTLIVWDLLEVLRKCKVEEPILPAVRPMEALWADLASDDAVVADRAIREVARSPGVAERFLARHLRPIEPVPARVLGVLIAELDGDRASTRDLAEGKLLALGEQAVPALREAEKAGPPEVRRRARRLLARLEVFARTGIEARPSRAIESLEMVGTTAARELLGDLAKGADSPLTREAKGAAARLRMRVSAEP